MNLPKIGLGTWMLKSAEASFSVIKAVKLGYRFIDTAQAYFNEKGVGDGLKEVIDTGIVKRKEIFVATKVLPLYYRQQLTYKSTLKSLKRLQLEYIDLMQIHFPAFNLGYSHKKTLSALSRLVDEGIINHLGISNFTVQHTKDAIDACDKPIFSNQVEHHPYLQQTELLEEVKNLGLKFISYSPLARGKALQDPTIVDIAQRNQISTAQVCLAWIMSKGAYPIPKATSVEHIEDNFKAVNVQLPLEDIKRIDSIGKTERYVTPAIISPKEWKK